MCLRGTDPTYGGKLYLSCTSSIPVEPAALGIVVAATVPDVADFADKLNFEGLSQACLSFFEAVNLWAVGLLR